jgi:hypothetical protein
MRTWRCQAAYSMKWPHIQRQMLQKLIIDCCVHLRKEGKRNPRQIDDVIEATVPTYLFILPLDSFSNALNSRSRGAGGFVVRIFCRRGYVRSVCIRFSYSCIEHICKSVNSTCSKPSNSQPLVEGFVCGRERKDGYRYIFNVKKTTP